MSHWDATVQQRHDMKTDLVGAMYHHPVSGKFADTIVDALFAAGVTDITDTITMTDQQITALPGIGEGALRVIRYASFYVPREG